MPTTPYKSMKEDLEKHLSTIAAEVAKGFMLCDPSKKGSAPIFARLVNIEREVWSIREILKHED